MLVDHAERELKAAGLFDTDGDYGGHIGPDVLELVRVFAAQGHSGGSMDLTLELFNKVIRYKTLLPLQNPMDNREYISHEVMLQSTRVSTVFSDDGGLTWYDIDRKVPWWKRKLFGVRRSYISFPYAA
jgi:hypothetical protein